MINATVTLATPRNVIKRRMLGALVAEANHRMRFRAPAMRIAVQRLLREALVKSPTVQELSMLGSPLQIELGLTDISGQQGTDPITRLDVIMNTIVDGVKVVFQPFMAAGHRKIAGGLHIYGVPFDHQDVLNLPEAIQINTFSQGQEWRSRTNTVPSFPWLDWLLVQGGNIVVSGHFVWTKGVNPQFSRTMKAVMRKGGGGYSIPAGHQGELGDNFITRAVDEIMKDDVPALLTQLL
jgi:hypothetical protein